MNAENKTRFLKLISAGHDPATAAAELGLDISIADDPELRIDIRAAQRLAIGKLRARLMQSALDSGDTRTLNGLLDRLEIMVGDKDQITHVSRVILDGRCRLCGHVTGQKTDDIGDKELARRLAFVIAKGAVLQESNPSTPGNGADHPQE